MSSKRMVTKQEEVAVIQWDGDNLIAVLIFLGRRIDVPDTPEQWDAFNVLKKKWITRGFIVTTKTGNIVVKVGDWIVRSEGVNYEILSQEELDRKYEEVL